MCDAYIAVFVLFNRDFAYFAKVVDISFFHNLSAFDLGDADKKIFAILNGYFGLHVVIAVFVI